MTCGAVAHCSRPALHRGHHGGWRSGVSAIAAQPVEHDHERGQLGQELTFRELQVIAEYVVHGSLKETAACLGLAVHTVRNHAAAAAAKTGATSSAHVAYVLGWAHPSVEVCR